MAEGYLGTLILCSSGYEAHAMDLAVSSGAMQLPNSSYHLLNFNSELRFDLGSSEVQFMFQLGGMPPFSAHGFTQRLFYSSINLEWMTPPAFLRMFSGLGLGIYADMVNQYVGPMGCLNLVGGLRAGSTQLGVQLAMSAYLGQEHWNDFLSYSGAWSLYVFTGGLYVGL
jgi:hypothetical protein